ncbi:hypothetical protein SCHPADRAFT_819769 [Schizopora paradoxa]|uniref:HSF-type DNA-binding domain-containing protein n=1 Tax=Schizopora paradoxa TaxID=27342 RepID=A0A0H2SNF0_9AGAM|nr:hypothetical protein SCHPADRAFT_819769 [Schizopora paradoxa]
MAADNQFQLSVIQPTQPAPLTKAARQVVPQFLQKLYEMVSNSSTNHLIKWSDAGDSFVVLDHERFARDVLPRWFKHNNFASFVRQLNMYGFHKIPHLQQGVLKSETETELWNFEHPSFRRNQPDLLCLITRKKQVPDRAGGEPGHGDIRETLTGAIGGDAVPPGTVMDVNTIMNGITSLKRHQAAISSELNDLKSSNQILWQEALAARERHDKHQQTINKILKFLAGVFGNPGSPHHKGSTSAGSPHPVIPRRRQPLLIENGNRELSPSIEVSKGNETVTSSVSSDESGNGASSTLFMAFKLVNSLLTLHFSSCRRWTYAFELRNGWSTVAISESRHDHSCN